MKHLASVLAASVTLTLSAFSSAASAQDAESFTSYEGITSEQSCYAPPFDDPETIRLFAQELTHMDGRVLDTLFSERVFEMRKATTECIRFTYDVDGVEVPGFMLRPANSTQDTPVLVYHRGGNGSFGMTGFMSFYTRFSELASEGYVIIGSNLREQDEFGGADVEDSRRILDIVKGMEHVDLDRIALWGVSRGATQMMQVARGRDDIQALVFAVGNADHERSLVTRPEMLNVYQARVPDFENNREQAMYDRSVVNWIDELPEVPILILHGEQDERVDVEQAHILAAVLDEHGRDYTLNIYPHLGHHVMGEPADDMLIWLEALSGR